MKPSMQHFKSLFAAAPIMSSGPTTKTAMAAQASLANVAANTPSQTFYTATGCFWGVEHIFRQHFDKGRGLIDCKVGYIGGHSKVSTFIV
jgi:peptide-methionine (S)-S-oxide reductase